MSATSLPNTRNEENAPEHPELLFNKFVNRLMGTNKQPNNCMKHLSSLRNCIKL